MENTCYRCNAPIAEDAPFCPACGAPQIRVSSQFLGPPPSEPVTAPQPQASVPAVVGAPPLPGEIQWKNFLRTAWPLALIAGVIALFSVIGFLFILPASVFVAIRLYYKRHRGIPRAGQGVKLGMAMGMISFIAFAGPSVLALSTSAQVRQEFIQTVNMAASRNPDPQAQQLLQNLLSSPQGFALMLGFGLFFTMIVFLVFTAIAGAVAASTVGSRTP